MHAIQMQLNRQRQWEQEQRARKTLGWLPWVLWMVALDNELASHLSSATITLVPHWKDVEAMRVMFDDGSEGNAQSLRLPGANL